MAHTDSAKKHIRRDTRRRVIRQTRVSRIRTFVKKVEKAIANGDRAAAQAAFAEAQPEMARGVNKGVLHQNTMARKVSRLNKRIKSMA